MLTAVEVPRELPPHESLSSQQQRGVHCVFCGRALCAGNAVDLGARLIDAQGSSARWFPRSCKSC
ncbi:hypothetical protein OIE76_06730 [Streptomyces sp. NBC_01727]|nr:hypothetical protein OIE76_06730 [Streptomyces sp. NBC_01727]